MSEAVQRLLRSIDPLQLPERIVQQLRIPVQISAELLHCLCNGLNGFLITVQEQSFLWLLSEQLCRRTEKTLTNHKSAKKQLRAIEQAAGAAPDDALPASGRSLPVDHPEAFPFASLWLPDRVYPGKSPAYFFAQEIHCPAPAPADHAGLHLELRIPFKQQLLPVQIMLPKLPLDEARSRFGAQFAALFKKVHAAVQCTLQEFLPGAEELPEIQLSSRPAGTSASVLLGIDYQLVFNGFSNPVRLLLPAPLLRPLLAGNTKHGTRSKTGKAAALAGIVLDINTRLLQAGSSCVKTQNTASKALLFHEFLNALHPVDLLLTVQAFVAAGHPLAELQRYCFRAPGGNGTEPLNAGCNLKRIKRLLPERMLELFKRDPGKLFSADSFIEESIAVMDRISRAHREGRLLLTPCGEQILRERFCKPREAAVRTLLAEMRAGDAVGYWYGKLSDTGRTNLSPFTGQHWFWKALHNETHIAADLLTRISHRNRTRFEEDLAYMEKEITAGRIPAIEILQAKQHLTSELQQLVEEESADSGLNRSK